MAAATSWNGSTWFEHLDLLVVLRSGQPPPAALLPELRKALRSWLVGRGEAPEKLSMSFKLRAAARRGPTRHRTGDRPAAQIGLLGWWLMKAGRGSTKGVQVPKSLGCCRSGTGEGGLSPPELPPPGLELTLEDRPLTTDDVWLPPTPAPLLECLLALSWTPLYSAGFTTSAPTDANDESLDPPDGVVPAPDDLKNLLRTPTLCPLP